MTISGATADIRGDDGNDLISLIGNQTVLTTPGTIDLGGGSNAFVIYEGATFNSGNIVDIGHTNVMLNRGDDQPARGGQGRRHAHEREHQFRRRHPGDRCGAGPEPHRRRRRDEG